ncbi:DUF1385 domain-containing protein [Candidatus Woesearchaeota archaeon]|nr:DUF1385 domain-containing protein [Candidatus Woesearchaeota archaeon]
MAKSVASKDKIMESIGGQAVIEGVMLRRKDSYSVAVRNPKGKIITTKHKIKDYRKGLLSVFKYPFFRGMYAMYEMLDIGMKTLIYSSNIATDEKDEKLTPLQLFWVVLTSVAFAIGLFVVVPYILTVLTGVKEHTNPIIFNLIDAAIKVIFFVAYVAIIGMMPDIKRVFQYHGAEHMTVHCHESTKKVTPQNCLSFTTIHPRCGSSFIMITIVISIIVFSLLPLVFIYWYPALFELNIWIQKTILGLLRIVILPIVMGISYEVLKLAGKYPDNPVMQLVSLPGMWLQKLTTSRPDKKQVEVAIAALNKLL